MEYLFIYGLHLADLLTLISEILISLLIIVIVVMVVAFAYKDENDCAKKGFEIL